jgi:two-component system sensor histidine kinase VanS
MDELKQANTKLKSDIERERAQEANRREFIATISHELKSPITIISGQLEGMIYNIGNFKDRDKYLRQSYDITQEMKGLVNEMLDLSKLESFEVKANMKVINITNVVEYVIENQQYFIKEKNMKLVENLQEDLFLFLDEQLIKKAIMNVVNNAIKYSNQNETIIINLYKKNDIYLEVENTGANIDENLIQEIFKPFYRIEKSRNRHTGGSGLGLYIVKKILDLNNVKYRIENKKSSVKFTMIFPHKI